MSHLPMITMKIPKLKLEVQVLFFYLFFLFNLQYEERMRIQKAGGTVRYTCFICINNLTTVNNIVFLFVFFFHSPNL